MYYKNISPQFLNQNGIDTKNLIFSPYFLPYNPRLKEFARKMRNNSQLAEVLLWCELKAKSTGYTFNRQYPILNYIVDFYCKELQLVVEVDGISHFSFFAGEKDEKRTQQLELLGVRIIRVLDSDIRNNSRQVFEFIMQNIADNNPPSS